MILATEISVNEDIDLKSHSVPTLIISEDAVNITEQPVVTQTTQTKKPVTSRKPPFQPVQNISREEKIIVRKLSTKRMIKPTAPAKITCHSGMHDWCDKGCKLNGRSSGKCTHERKPYFCLCS
ncbi:uncharacterized protein LOC129605451 [Condylostylus longicornis]|uniref:uncharacterized protein LOC129605451 n=1 Tax=Condylostylus longicornis TaxID=2530218 RepID=UPI00244DFF2F|nr:uncharacterized protein LOC129605451 [Condylostylus longicornis]